MSEVNWSGFNEGLIRLVERAMGRWEMRVWVDGIYMVLEGTGVCVCILWGGVGMRNVVGRGVVVGVGCLECSRCASLDASGFLIYRDSQVYTANS